MDTHIVNFCMYASYFSRDYQSFDNIIIITYSAGKKVFVTKKNLNEHFAKLKFHFLDFKKTSNHSLYKRIKIRWYIVGPIKTCEFERSEQGR